MHNCLTSKFVNNNTDDNNNNVHTYILILFISFEIVAWLSSCLVF